MPAECEVTRGAAAELALGTLSGDERSTALSHLDSCPGCRRVVDDLALAADSLLLTAPQEDPPVGFEVELLERVRREHAAGARRFHRARESLRSRSVRLGAGIAAAVLVAAGAGIGIGEALAPGAVASPHGVEIASLESSSHQAAGVVALTSTSPSWLFMNVSDLGGTAWVRCVVTLTDGKQVAVGSFDVQSGYGDWSVRLPASWTAHSLKEAKIESASGKVLATAVF